jgi:hypothetical protein
MRLYLLVAITLVIITLSSCASSRDRYKDAGIEETISVQSTRIAHLSTQVAHLEQTNASQRDAISYLSTQMPFALELITPISPGTTLKPTPYSPPNQETEPTFMPMPSASIDIEYPPDTRTGIKEFDQVIDVIMDKDIEARLDLVQFTKTTCTTTGGLGGPPECEPGEADGTVVDAFPVSNGEGHFVRPDNIQEVFDFTVRGLFAVYVVPEDAYHADYWPAGEYGIIFTSEDGGYPHIITVLVENTFIVRLEFNPGWPPFELVWGKSDEFILSPIR